jgi:lysophospholipase L1-like esterase
LQELLTKRHRGTFEIVNAGIEGYNSAFALARIKDEVIRYRPQLVTIYIGWNDLMKMDPANVAATGRYAHLAQVMENSYLIKAYRKVMFLYLRPLLFRPRVGNDGNEAHAYDDFVPSTYRENLESMIGVLRSSGIQTMLFTLPTVVRPNMRSEELRRQNVFFPYFAGTYSVARFLSLHRAYNSVIRMVGKKSGVPVVDLDAIFNKHDKDELFWDTMHPSRKGHRLIAEAVYKAIAEQRNGETSLFPGAIPAHEPSAQ